MKSLIILLLLTTSITATAQNYVAPDPNPRQMEEAKALAQELDMQLSLTEKQLLAVEKLNGEFIARRDLIVGNQGITILEKNRALQAMYQEQGKEMADIITRPQLNRYEEIRGNLQPLIVLTDQ